MWILYLKEDSFYQADSYLGPSKLLQTSEEASEWGKQEYRERFRGFHLLSFCAPEETGASIPGTSLLVAWPQDILLP